MLEGFATHLGSDSPVVRSLASIEPLARDSKEAASQFRQAGQTLAGASVAITDIVNRTAGHLEQAVSLIIARIEQGFAAGREEIIETGRMAAGETAAAVVRVGDSTDGLLKASAAISETVDRTIRQLDGTIASIPGRIEKGFVAGSNELVEFSRMAATETAAAIAGVGRSTAGLDAASTAIAKTVDQATRELNNAISTIPSLIGQSSAEARNELMEAGRAAGNEAVTAIANAGNAEVEKLKQAAASIREGAIPSSQHTGRTVPVGPGRDGAVRVLGETIMERQLRRAEEVARRREEETAPSEYTEPVSGEAESPPAPPRSEPPPPPEPEKRSRIASMFRFFRRKK